MEKDILVITPTLGNRLSLSKTISSVNKYGNNRIFHVIVCPKSKVGDIKKSFPFVEVICEPDGCNGIYEALNYSIYKYADKYNYLAYINDDDYWLADFSKLIAYLDSNSLVDVVYGKVKYIDAGNIIIGEQTSSPRYKSFESLLSRGIILFTQQATLMRTRVFLEIGGFDTNYKLISDTIFWCKAINNKYVFFHLNALCACYMFQDGQLSSDKNTQINEHYRYLKSVEIDHFSSITESIYFRIYNFSNYFKRLILKYSYINNR